MKTIEEVMRAFEVAALNAGLSRNTRRTYAATIAEFSTMMKRGEISGVQDYLDHLASVKRTPAPPIRILPRTHELMERRPIHSDSKRTLLGVPCSDLFALADTRIEMAGVMRCCLGTVAEEYEGKDGAEDQKVSIGMKSQCRHCKKPFTLVNAKPHPKWKPDWQLHGANIYHNPVVTLCS